MPMFGAFMGSFWIPLVLMVLGVPMFSFAATRPVIYPGMKQALIVIQSFDRQTGEVDDDPQRLYGLMSGPVRKAPSGDEGKVIETSSRDFNLTCVERLSSGTVQCQFIIQSTGEFCKVDGVLQEVSCKILGSEALEIIRDLHMKEGEETLAYRTSDGRLLFAVMPDEVTLKFSGSY